MADILLLEDDALLLETITEFLQGYGHTVTCVYDGESALDDIYYRRYDLLILDVNVPKLSGFELLVLLRKANIQTPAIYITSLGSIEDLDMGYKSGADDYLRKPFELKELHLRINALLSRSFAHQVSNSIHITSAYTFDLNTNRVLYQGEAVKLAPKELKLLKLFLKNRGNIISNEQIYEELWENEEPSELSLRAFIKSLRKIFGKESIESFKRIGYKFAL